MSRDSPLARLQGQTILGTEKFVDRIRRAYVLTRTGDRREQPALARARRFEISLSGLTVARPRIEEKLRQDQAFSKTRVQLERQLKDLVGM